LDTVPYGHTTHMSVLCRVWGVMCDAVSTHARAQTRNITSPMTPFFGAHRRRLAPHAAALSALPQRRGPPSTRRPRHGSLGTAASARRLSEHGSLGRRPATRRPSLDTAAALRGNARGGSEGGLVCPSGRVYWLGGRAGGRGGMGHVRISGAPAESRP